MIYVAFDVGNVLVQSSTDAFCTKLSKNFNITMEDAQHFTNKCQKINDIGCTLMADEISSHFRVKSSAIIDELMYYWSEAIQPADWMIDKLIEMAKQHDLKIALLSNVGLEHVPRMRQLLNNYTNLVGGMVEHFSCHVGARKPTALFYQSFLQLHPEWKGCGYIDDLQENLDASKQFGFRTFRLALNEITGENYDEDKYNEKMAELEIFILEEPWR